MKKILIVLSLGVCIFNVTYSQNFESLTKVQFDNQNSYYEYLDRVSDCCSYVLQTPYDKKDDERFYANDFIFRWMKGYEDCKFEISDNIRNFTEQRDDLLALYSVSYASVFIERIREKSDKERVDMAENAINKFLSYCEKDMNKIKLTREMKSVVKLREKGKYTTFNDFIHNEK